MSLMARKRRIILCGIGLLVICAAGAYLVGHPGKGGPGKRTDADTRFDINKGLFASIRSAERLVLYEGLPHQFYESKKLEQEKKQKDTLELHGYPFYREPLDVTAETNAGLKQFMSDESSIRQWPGESECGGFHPDYLAEWHVGDAVYRFLICFGCREAKVFGPSQSLRCDIEWDLSMKLESLLKPLRKNRPEIPPRWRG